MGISEGAAGMEIIQSVETVRGKVKITFESGWKVWLNRNASPGFPFSEGTQVDRNDFEKYILLHQYPAALSRAVHMLAERPHSRKEIERSLASARFDRTVTELVLYKLDTENLLDDHDFAEQWVQSRSRKYGSDRLYRELLIKGIDTETSKSVLNHISEDEQMEHAVSFAAKKIRSLRGTCDVLRIKHRVVSSLVRRGYSWSLAAKAFEKALRLE